MTNSCLDLIGCHKMFPCLHFLCLIVEYHFQPFRGHTKFNLHYPNRGLNICFSIIFFLLCIFILGFKYRKILLQGYPNLFKMPIVTNNLLSLMISLLIIYLNDKAVTYNKFLMTIYILKRCQCPHHEKIV